MTAAFECEVRFTDHYLRPAASLWDPRERALRVREHHVPAGACELLLTHVEISQADGLTFKRAKFVEGKVRL